MPRTLKKPTTERVILLVAGESGTGKSFFIANLKNALIFDTDIGGGLAYADERIRRNGSERIEVGSYLEVMDELNKRRGSLANYYTVAIDQVTSLNQEAILRYNPKMIKDFGSASEKAAKEWRKIREIIRWGDFNLVCTSHLKGRWEDEKIVGLQSDAAKGIERDFAVVLHLTRTGGFPATAMTQPAPCKWRRDPEDARGAVPASFPFTVENFESINGSPFGGVNRQEVPLATPEQVRELERLLSVVRLPEDTIQKWLSKAKVDSWSEMPADSIQKAIAHLEGLVRPVGPMEQEGAA